MYLPMTARTTTCPRRNPRMAYACALALLLHAPTRLMAVTDSGFFSNPVLENLADPFMFRNTDPGSGEVVYYLAGTSFNRYRSADMVHWERLGSWASTAQSLNWPGANGNAISGVWACELIKRNSTYHLYFSAVKPDGSKRVIYVATGSNIEGSFTINSTPVVELPTHGAIDPHPFRDRASGKYYLYYSQDQASDPGNIARIYTIELADNMLGAKAGTSADLCIEAETQAWENKWQEGAAVREHNGTYYLFYSSRCYCDESYSTGYATALSPKGSSWTKYAGNPVLSQTSSILGKVSGPGHIGLIQSPDGSEDWMAYHAHVATAAGGQRHVAIDRYHFETDLYGGPDIVVVDGPTLTKQPLPTGGLALPTPTALETFDGGGTLDRQRWSHICTEVASRYSLTGTHLQIEPDQGVLFTDGVDSPAKNIVLQQAPTGGGWFAETSLAFTNVPPDRLNDVRAGLVVWQDARHHVAFLADAQGNLRIETCQQTWDGIEAAEATDLGMPVVDPHFLRLVRSESGNEFVYFASADGSVYTQVATAASTLSDERISKAGVCAFSKTDESAVDGASVLFEWFQLNPLVSVPALVEHFPTPTNTVNDLPEWTPIARYENVDNAASTSELLTNGLDYGSAVAGIGNLKAFAQDGWVHNNHATSGNRFTRSLGSPVGLAEGSTLYFSAIIKGTKRANFGLGHGSGTDFPELLVSIGVQPQVSNAAGGCDPASPEIFSASIWLGDTNTYQRGADTGIVVDSNANAMRLVAGRMVNNAGAADEISYHVVNLASNVVVPASWTAKALPGADGFYSKTDFDFGGDLVFSNLYINLQNNGGLDEIRFAPTYLDVVDPGTPGGYAGWAALFNLAGGSTDDDDEDGAKNLYEYAVGGDPTNPAYTGIAPATALDNDGGTNGFIYIYPRLTDPASGLDYRLIQTGNLATGSWTNGIYTETGSADLGNGFEAVTNRFGTGETSKFIRLQAEAIDPAP